MKSLILVATAIYFAPFAAAQVRTDWSSPTAGTLGPHTVTASGFEGAYITNGTLSGSDFSGAPLAGVTEVIRYDGLSNWTVTFSPPVERLVWYGLGIQGNGGSSTGQPVLYVFDQPFEILSGFSQATTFATTLRLPSTGSHNGILRFTGPVTSISCVTNNISTNNQNCTFAQYERDLGTRYCNPAVANSTGVPAAISAYGSDYPSDNLLTLGATALAQSSFAFFLTSQTQDMIPMPGGSFGNLCLGGSIGRYVGPGQVLPTGLFGDIELVLDLTAHPTPNGFVSVASGETWNFQCWYRDSVAGTAGSNFSDALSITFR